MTWLACFLWVLLVGVLLGLFLSRLLGLLYNIKKADSEPSATTPTQAQSTDLPVPRPCLQTWFSDPALKAILGRIDVTAESLDAVLGVDRDISSALHANGIRTLFDLASASPKLLEFIVARSGLDSPRVPTDTWPRQAQYIVENRLEDLKQYRSSLNS
jgi:hypothetical protein